MKFKSLLLVPLLALHMAGETITGPLSKTIDEDTNATWTTSELYATDSDTSASSLAWSLLSSPSNGTATFSGNGSAPTTLAEAKAAGEAAIAAVAAAAEAAAVANAAEAALVAADAAVLDTLSDLSSAESALYFANVTLQGTELAWEQAVAESLEANAAAAEAAAAEAAAANAAAAEAADAAAAAAGLLGRHERRRRVRHVLARGHDGRLRDEPRLPGRERGRLVRVLGRRARRRGVPERPAARGRHGLRHEPGLPGAAKRRRRVLGRPGLIPAATLY